MFMVPLEADLRFSAIEFAPIVNFTPGESLILTVALPSAESSWLSAEPCGAGMSIFRRGPPPEQLVRTAREKDRWRGLVGGFGVEGELGWESAGPSLSSPRPMQQVVWARRLWVAATEREESQGPGP